jgi:superfamily I DNA/RNA helicase/RecB family exonuclease
MKIRAKELKLVRRASARPALSFSSAQLAAISHRASPLVIYGGPGTGKTSTLIEAAIARVRDGIDPNSMLILTYGRERASDLRDAIALRAGSTSFEPLARTFHALAFSILNQKLGEDDLRYVLISGAEQDSAIQEMLINPLVRIPWHPELERALTTRGFVREVRDLILRATELGLTPKDLIAMGERLGERYWEGAAHFWASYHGAQELASATVGERLIKIDPSAIIFEAIELLRNDPERLRYFRRRFTTILVDEFQESDPSHRALLKMLAGDDLVLAVDPDSAIGRFRGADPDGVLQACEELTSQAITLEIDYRSRPEITDLGVAVASRFRKSAPTRVRQSAHPRGSGAIEFAKLTGATESADYIAYSLRRAHLHDGVAWSQMAVLVRDPGSEVAAIQRAFARNAIPLNVDGAALALAQNPAVIPLLDLAELAIKRSTVTARDWPLIEALLFSEFGGADALALRQIRIALTQARSDHRSTTEMMIETLITGIPEIPWEQMLPIKRLHDLLQAARKVLAHSPTITDLLWSIWENSVDYEGRKISTLWQERALQGGVKGAQADRDIDAVIALFESARRFTERNLGAKPQLFIDQLRSERILSDSITSSAQREEVVSLLTVHSAKGLEWDYVVLAGLQEGSWPNLKERGSLLGSERLVESIRSGLTSPAEISAAAASGLIEDERRLLHVAISRARKRLLITAYSNEDSIPSSYFDDLYEHLTHQSADEFRSEPQRSLTSQGIVAELRREVERGSEFAASLLAKLANSGIKNADPAQWLGMRELSTQAPIVAPGELIHVSPSSLGSFDDCGLKWFLEKSGAQDGDSTAQLLGVAIHYIASQVAANPELTAEEGINQLINAWPVVDQNVGWYKADQLATAKRMLTRFFEWNERNPRELVSAESSFEVQFGRVLLRGTIDRLEIDPGTGQYFVVDLKTGAQMSAKDALVNKQLFAYQLGIVEGGFGDLPTGATSSGAGLLYLAKETIKNETLDQGPVEAETFKEAVALSAEGMAGSTFTAIINDRCRSCKLKALCPLQSEGRSLLE